jgi:N-acetylmuramic acid 6-phosphate etherase
VNEKLVKRSQRILTKLTGHGGDDARAALALAGGNLKIAVLLLHGCDLNEATDILGRAGGQLRAALSLVDKPAKDSGPKYSGRVASPALGGRFPEGN